MKFICDNCGKEVKTKFIELPYIFCSPECRNKKFPKCTTPKELGDMIINKIHLYKDLRSNPELLRYKLPFLYDEWQNHLLELNLKGSTTLDQISIIYRDWLFSYCLPT